MGWQLAEQASQIGTAYHSTFKCLHIQIMQTRTIKKYMAVAKFVARTKLTLRLFVSNCSVPSIQKEELKRDN